MLTQTNQARAVLLFITAVWFGVPVVGWLFETGAGIRVLGGFAERFPTSNFVVLITAIYLGTELYPPRAEGSTKRTVLPLVSLVLCLVGYNWIDRERTIGEFSGLIAFVATAAPCLMAFFLLPVLLRTQHRNIFFCGPVLVVVTLWVSHRVFDFEHAQTRRRGDRIVAALKVFREREDCYPSSLAGLVPRDLNEVPRPIPWFWLGSTFHYDTWEFREPSERPTASRIWCTATWGLARSGARRRRSGRTAPPSTTTRSSSIRSQGDDSHLQK